MAEYRLGCWDGDCARASKHGHTEAAANSLALVCAGRGFISVSANLWAASVQPQTAQNEYPRWEVISTDVLEYLIGGKLHHNVRMDVTEKKKESMVAWPT